MCWALFCTSHRTHSVEWEWTGADITWALCQCATEQKVHYQGKICTWKFTYLKPIILLVGKTNSSGSSESLFLYHVMLCVCCFFCVCVHVFVESQENKSAITSSRYFIQAALRLSPLNCTIITCAVTIGSTNLPVLCLLPPRLNYFSSLPFKLESQNIHTSCRIMPPLSPLLKCGMDYPPS